MGINFASQQNGFPYPLNENGSHSERAFTPLSAGLCFHTSTSETSISGIKEFSGPDFNPDFQSFRAAVNTAELRFHAQFKQYATYLKALRIRPLKTDLIFPFHTFW